MEILYTRLGYIAKVTKGSGDYGADLILQQGSKRIVVQAKRYRKKIGIKAVQEVRASMDYYHAEEGWVVSNSYYTDAAIELARYNQIKLINRNQLIKLIISSRATAS
ncbi:restriction endonuclease [Sutcliffiella sp. NPDC057660]|uniref:restriction endonuclease n=1 Tax=Sutcliffiella sp. NPDC057660 TaxID=3346199 RepID=UPI0036BF2908